MVRRLIADSCADFTPEKKKWTDVRLVPLTLTVDKEDIVDDETFCQKKFLEKMRRSLECPRSACPSPERYMREFEGADEIFVVTLSKHLSGSYQSAMLAKQMYSPGAWFRRRRLKSYTPSVFSKALKKSSPLSSTWAV